MNAITLPRDAIEQASKGKSKEKAGRAPTGKPAAVGVADRRAAPAPIGVSNQGPRVRVLVLAAASDICTLFLRFDEWSAAAVVDIFD